ncbi:hypothetical protein D3C71_1948460 [compost metagenome]
MIPTGERVQYTTSNVIEVVLIISERKMAQHNEPPIMKCRSRSWPTLSSNQPTALVPRNAIK